MSSLFLALFAAASLCSCGKDPAYDYDAVRFNGEYAGRYVLESASLESPVDFVGHGNRTDDIIGGLGLSQGEVDAIAACVYDGDGYARVSTLDVPVPFQLIERRGGKLEPRGGNATFPVRFHYTVQRDGGILASGQDGDMTEALGSYYERLGDGAVERNPQLLRCGDARIERLGGGELTMTMTMCCVDWSDVEMKSVRARFTYRRK